MTRFRRIARKPKTILSALAIIALAAALVVGTGANYTATAANPGNTFATGSLSILNDQDGLALFNVTNAKPGDDVTGTVDITNTGSLSGDFSLTTENVTGDAALRGALHVYVDMGTRTGNSINMDGGRVYDGTLADLHNVDLPSPNGGGSWASGESHVFEIHAALPSTEGNATQGQAASVDFRWNATS